MQNILLGLVVVAIFVFGYFVAIKFGAFLDKNLNQLAPIQTYDREQLRIALSDPMAAGDLVPAIELFSRDNPTVEICLYTGPNRLLMQQLENASVELILVSEQSEPSAPTCFCSRELRLKSSPLKLQTAERSIEPLEPRSQIQNALWRKGYTGRWADLFIFEYIETARKKPV